MPEADFIQVFVKRRQESIAHFLHCRLRVATRSNCSGTFKYRRMAGKAIAFFAVHCDEALTDTMQSCELCTCNT
jgi:hypothetical protein